MSKKKKILFLGQTPPPFHGQALIIEMILNHDYRETELIDIRLNFSSRLSDVGKFKASKILNLFQVLWKSFHAMTTYKVMAIYYPPSGHALIPTLRDISILAFLRLFRKKIIFHWHILGVKEFYQRSNSLLKWAMRKVYSNSWISICLSKNNIQEIKWLNPGQIRVIHNGIKDYYKGIIHVSSNNEKIPHILFVGNLYKSKGVLLLLDAARLIDERGLNFKLSFVGGFKEKVFQEEVESHSMSKGSKVHFEGVLIGDRKWELYADADIFCFPPIGKEAFPTVVLEASCFGLPILISEMVSSKNDMVEGNGYVVKSGDLNGLADKLEALIINPKLRQEFGKRSRDVFERKFSEQKFLLEFKKLFREV